MSEILTQITKAALIAAAEAFIKAFDDKNKPK